MTKTIITLEKYGTMTFQLFPDRAPITAANFIKVSNSGFYDGLAFFRIVKGYVIQAGSPDNEIMTDSEFHIIGEFESNGHPTGIDHRRGAISMARDDAPNTAGTQFFIIHQDAHKLDKNYAAFGYMLTGFDVLDRLADLKTSSPDTWNRPLVLPVIKTIRVQTEEAF